MSSVSLQYLVDAIFYQMDKIYVQQTGTNRKIWRLGPVSDEGHVTTELVIRMQGILAKSELVPGNVSR